MTINLLDRRNRDTDLAALTSRHNANPPPPSLSSFLAPASLSFTVTPIEIFGVVVF